MEDGIWTITNKGYRGVHGLPQFTVNFRGFAVSRGITNTFLCPNCGDFVQHRPYGETTRCPKCGEESEAIVASAENSGFLSQELTGTVTNKQGDLIAERIQKTDRNTSANLSADAGEPTRISIERKARIRGFEEEGHAAMAMVISYNKIRKTLYRVEQKVMEISDYADRLLFSDLDKPQRLNIQIRHLDDDIIANVGRWGVFDGSRTPADLVESICSAVTDKANVDSKVKAETILLLMVPVPLGEEIRLSIEAISFDFKGFKEIWITPFHEDSFPLTAS